MGDSIGFISQKTCSQPEYFADFMPVQKQSKLQLSPPVMKAGVEHIIWDSIPDKVKTYGIAAIIGAFAFRLLVPARLRRVLLTIAVTCAIVMIVLNDKIRNSISKVPFLNSIIPQAAPEDQIQKSSRRICGLKAEVEEAHRAYISCLKKTGSEAQCIDSKEYRDQLEQDLIDEKHNFSTLEQALSAKRGDYSIPAEGYTSPCNTQ